MTLGRYKSLGEHPLPRLLAAGVRVSVNADNPLFCGHSLVGEYDAVRSTFGLDASALAGIARESIRASGMPEAEKQTAAAGVDAWLAGKA